jgi:SAM-dependent methyltransferase
MDKLHQIGLVKTTIAPVCTKKYNFILEHKLIDFVALPEEWSPAMKIDAAIMHLDLHKELIKNDWCLWDGHEYNIFFDYTRPVWIDFHSIKSIIVQAGGTAWWNEFKFNIFDRLGCDEALWKTEFEKVKSEPSKERSLIFMETMKKAILAVQINPVKTPWFDYPRLSDTNLDDKQRTTLEIMEKVKPFCETFLDIGCNVGWYSKAASQMGYKVVAIDVDEACIDELYTNTKASRDKILPLVSDFKTCLDVIACTHPTFAKRIQCDVTLSLALLHHLVFFQNATFPFIAERLNALSKKAAIVQFITREDSYVKHWLKSLGTKFDWYTMDNFILEMSKYFSEYKIFESSPSGRKLILFER